MRRTDMKGQWGRTEVTPDAKYRIADDEWDKRVLCEYVQLTVIEKTPLSG